MSSSVFVKSILESDELHHALESVVDEKLDTLMKNLIESGLDEDKVSKVFGNFTCDKKENLSSSFREDYDQNTKTFSRRFLKPNTSKEYPSQESTPQADAPQTNKPTIKKFGVKHDKKVIYVLNYGKNSDALFGPFDKTYETFKDKYLKPTFWIKANARLAFGFGWLVTTLQETGKEKLAQEPYP